MKGKQWIVLIATIASIFGLYWINSGQTSLKTTGEVAGREEAINYTLPPGFIFSIWGLIYLGFIVYAFYGISNKGARDRHMNRTAYPVALSIVLNLLWTIIVGLDLWVWAYPLQWLMLVIAIIILFRFELRSGQLSFVQRFLSIPFGLYAGWLTVAMIPFTADLLNECGWDHPPFSKQTWAIIIYVVACLIVVAAHRRLRQPFYLLPLPWALFGFYTRFDGTLSLVAIVLCALMTIYLLWNIFLFYKNSKVNPAGA